MVTALIFIYISVTSVKKIQRHLVAFRYRL